MDSQWTLLVFTHTLGNLCQPQRQVLVYYQCNDKISAFLPHRFTLRINTWKQSVRLSDSVQMGAIKAPQTEKPEPWLLCDLHQAALLLSPALPELSSLSCVISCSQITLKTSRSFFCSSPLSLKVSFVPPFFSDLQLLGDFLSNTLQGWFLPGFLLPLQLLCWHCSFQIFKKKYFLW